MVTSPLYQFGCVINTKIYRLKHKVDVANTMMKINIQKDALNGIKKLTTKKDPREFELPGP